MAFRRKPPPGNVRRVAALGQNARGVTTNKRGHLVQFESELEHTLVLLFERDPSVVDYHSQPEVLHFCDAAGRSRTYTPDFKVWRADGRIELHEVSVEARRTLHAGLPPREAAALAICQARGWRYIVHTDQTLPSGQEYTNLSFLAPYRSQVHAAAPVTAWWIAQLDGQGPVHPRAVLARADSEAPTGVLLNGLYHLLWHGVIQIAWQQPLIHRGDFHPTARIWLASQAASP